MHLCIMAPSRLYHPRLLQRFPIARVFVCLGWTLTNDASCSREQDVLPHATACITLRLLAEATPIGCVALEVTHRHGIVSIMQSLQSHADDSLFQTIVFWMLCVFSLDATTKATICNQGGVEWVQRVLERFDDFWLRCSAMTLLQRLVE